MASRKRGKEPKEYKQNSKQRRPNRSPSPPAYELPFESRSPSPVALRNRQRRAGSESPDPVVNYRPPWHDNEKLGYRSLPSNYLRFKKEVKHKYHNRESVDVSYYSNLNTREYSYNIIPVLANIPVGNGPGQRDGDSITIVRIAMKMWFMSLYSYFSAGGVLNPPPAGMPIFDTKQNLRVCLIKDNFSQGQGGASVADSLIFDETLFPGHHDMTYRNPNTTSRFEILYDEIHCIYWDPPVTYGEGVSPGAAAGVGWYPRRSTEPVEIFLDVNIKCHYATALNIPENNNVFLRVFPGPTTLHLARYQEAYIGGLTSCVSFVEN